MDEARRGIYSEKALAANPTDISNVFNVGVNYMIVGDDTDTAAANITARHYRLQGLVPRLQGEHTETQGRTVELAPFRKYTKEHRSRLKSSLRRCEPTSGQSIRVTSPFTLTEQQSKRIVACSTSTDTGNHYC